jgi:hypothetical protein
MAFDPERWVQVADVCCSGLPGVNAQALLRTAVNRAYYAALMSVRLRIEQVHGAGAVPRARTHYAILRTLQLAGGTFQPLHAGLITLKRLREVADHELNASPLIAAEVLKVVEVSRALIRHRINAIPDAEFRRLAVRRD